VSRQAEYGQIFLSGSAFADTYPAFVTETILDE
jgi:hypothetical protein